MTAVERLLAVARKEVGYLGKRSAARLDDPAANQGGLYTKYARDLDALGDFYNGRKQGYDWCDVFVDWCFVTAFGPEGALALTCQPKRSCGAGTKYSMGYYQAKGRLFAAPEPGDQIFFGDAKVTTHTGLVERVSGGCVYTIEGNAGSPSGVRRCKYPLGYAKIKGCGRPDWSLATEEEEDDMTYYKTLNDVPSYYRPAVEKAVKAGALTGTGDGLNVSEDLCRTLTVLDRMGKLG